MTPRELMAALAAPFDPDAVSWRLGPTNDDKTKGMALPYIDARDVQERLDTVVGVDWQCEFVPMGRDSCCCRIGLLIGGQWRWRSDGGIVVAESDKAEAREMAEKGSFSDAFKRAAVKWGIGSFLYKMDSPWVEIEPRGKSYAIKKTEYARLRAVLSTGAKVQANVADSEPRDAGPAVSRSERPAAAAHTPEPKRTAPAEAKAASQEPLDKVPSLSKAAKDMLDGLLIAEDADDIDAWEAIARANYPRLSREERTLLNKEWGSTRTRLRLPTKARAA